MKALLLDSNGKLSLAETHSPPLFPQGVRVEVKAVGINRADILQAAGHYPAPHGTRGDILGLEYSGMVIEVDSAVQYWSIGDRVMGIVPGASYAEQVVVHEGECMRIPDHLDWVEAAAIPEAFLTAYDAMQQLEVCSGQTLLVHAVGSGVGVAAAQLSRAMGIRCVGTTRTARKVELLSKYGVDIGLWVQAGDFLSGLREQVDHVDAIIDCVGSAYLQQNLSALRPQGRLLVLGLLGGRVGDIDLGKILRKRLRIQGTVLRSRSTEEKIVLVQDFIEHILPMFVDNAVLPVVDEVFEMGNMELAHSSLVRNRNVGKLIAHW